MRENQLQKSISLNEEKRKAEQEKDEERRSTHSDVDGEITSVESGTIEVKRLKLKDLYLQESLFVLADMIAFRES